MKIKKCCRTCKHLKPQTISKVIGTPKYFVEIKATVCEFENYEQNQLVNKYCNEYNQIDIEDLIEGEKND